MSAVPQFKIYNSSDEYIGCVKHLEDAAALVSIQGEGATIRNGHRKKDTLWHEGSEAFEAGESYSSVADVCSSRITVAKAKGGAA